MLVCASASVFKFPEEGTLIAGAKQGGFFHISEHLVASEGLKGAVDLHGMSSERYGF